MSTTKTTPTKKTSSPSPVNKVSDFVHVFNSQNEDLLMQVERTIVHTGRPLYYIDIQSKNYGTIIQVARFHDCDILALECLLHDVKSFIAKERSNYN